MAEKGGEGEEEEEGKKEKELIKAWENEKDREAREEYLAKIKSQIDASRYVEVVIAHTETAESMEVLLKNVKLSPLDLFPQPGYYSRVQPLTKAKVNKLVRQYLHQLPDAATVWSENLQLNNEFVYFVDELYKLEDNRSGWGYDFIQEYLAIRQILSKFQKRPSDFYYAYWKRLVEGLHTTYKARIRVDPQKAIEDLHKILEPLIYERSWGSEFIQQNFETTDEIWFKARAEECANCKRQKLTPQKKEEGGV